MPKTNGVVVEVHDLHKQYGAKVAVDNVSLTVRRGEIFGILGPNGAGKTTTVECIAGLRTPDSGTIHVLGVDPVADRGELTRLVGVQLQASQLPERLRVGEALELYASFYADPADTEELIETLGLDGVRDTAYAKLSGGQQQRLSIALALVGKPTVAILDELTTGLDPQARRDTWALVRQIRDRGVTIILVTHFMDEAEYLCDRVAVIDAGRVVATDSPAGLVAGITVEQTLTFRVSRPLDEDILSGLLEVIGVRTDGDRVEVRGVGNLLVSVVTTLAQHGIAPTELHSTQPSLDDAFVALTGDKITTTTTSTEGALR